MFKQVLRVLHGWLYWTFFKIINNISYKWVILILSGENEALDFWAVRHLNDFKERKCAEKSMIIFYNNAGKNVTEKAQIRDGQVIKRLLLRNIELLYDYYCFCKFFDNIVFTYISIPETNLMERILNETDINEEEAVCLALYHLREIPGGRNKTDV